MTDLASRLRSIVKGQAPRRELTYEPEPRVYEHGTDLSRVAGAIGGRPIDGPSGPCLVVERRYEAERCHGGLRVGDCQVADDDALRLLDPALAPAVEDGDCGRIVFLDLETTGLSGGAGTVAFLVGCGYFDLGAFQVRQFLLTSYAAERALLGAVAEFVGPASLIVTYNGKTFDLPVMETRWLFHRIAPPFEGKRHFDMLHPARRLWRDRWGRASEADDGERSRSAQDGGESSDCSLGALERALFGVRRAGDVTGFEIPSRYFRFLRSGDARPLEPVLEHNRLDLISLAAVMSRALGLVRQGEAACRTPHECFALGRVYERAGRYDAAASCYRRAAADPGLRARALQRLAVRLRRDRLYGEAAHVWEDLLGDAAAEPLRREAAEALAVHHEHRLRDLRAARRLALAALAASRDAAGEQALRYRLARLDRKIASVRTRGGLAAAPLLRALRTEN
jgi:uncharacterized protein YprB with RNaseH-like and TPR domain